MKRILIMFSCLAFTLLYADAIAQEQKTKKEDDREPRNLRGHLTGRWELTDTNENSIGVWDFQDDGKFQSTGHYLSKGDASFRTDENRLVVYIQIDEEITEWKAKITEDGIKMTEINPEKKGKPVEFYLKKIEKQPEKDERDEAKHNNG